MTTREDTIAGVLAGVRARPARQQPDWERDPLLAPARAALAAGAPLVRAGEVDTLHAALARVATGEALVLQAGDCAENPDECGVTDVHRKIGLIDVLAGTLRLAAHRPVVRVGRMAGQFAKPRSSDTEVVGGRTLPAYRGHLINGPEPDPRSRRPDPRRLLTGYHAARQVLGHLGWPAPAEVPAGPPVWVSHEALLLDYELPQVRRADDGRLLITSTHWPWLGDRTRQLDGAHVALLAAVANPVAAKVGPHIGADDLVRLCAALDPARTPGRLTLISRIGAEATADRLPGLVSAVRRAGHPVVWLSDPMHGNTVRTPSGLKTRYLRTVLTEVRDFQCAVRTAGGVAGGLHLETTPDEVTECVTTADEAGRVGDKYLTLCDPRLNPGQAVDIVRAWNG